MNDTLYLRDLVVILTAAVIVVAVLHRFRAPTIAGFLLSGVLVGPNGFGLVGDVHHVEALAEIGVALLLFGIGLEISLSRLKRLWQSILLAGTLQVGVTTLATFLIARALAVPINTALLLGFLVAVSSTAIVLRGLEARGEIDAPHGRLTVGILVFQDLCVVPILFTIPLLAGQDLPGGTVFTALLRLVGVIVGVLVAARLVIPRVLHYIAGTRQRHLFVLTVMLASIGIAWIISSAGISLALGAFLAGLVVADSEYRHQALADLIPFREVFTSVFFVSVGMLLDLPAIWGDISSVALTLLAIIIGKFLVVFVVGLSLRLPVSVSALAGAALAQVGEFSFVIERAAQSVGLLPPDMANIILTAAILSMLLTPFGLSLGPRLAAGVGKLRVLNKFLKVTGAEEALATSQRLEGHVIIGGYGFAGEQLAQALESCHIPYLIVDLNPENVRRARSSGKQAFFGDVTNLEVLERLGADHAAELVLVINDPSAVERSVRAARSLSPSMPITVRTRYLSDVAPIMAAGVTEVIPAEREAAVEVVERVLRRREVGSDYIADRCRQIRKIHREDTE